MKMKELINKTIQWMEERNFFGEGGAIIEVQKMKFFEEYGEYCGNKVRGRDTKDDIGDMMVVSIALLKLKEKEIDMKYLLHDYFKSAPSMIPSYCQQGAYYSLFRACMELTTENGYTPEECLRHAYNEIKDRKGKFVNGSFIKEADDCVE